MSLSCPILNDIIIAEINEIKKTISNISTGGKDSKNITTKYDLELENIKNKLDTYRSAQTNNSQLMNKLYKLSIDNLANKVNLLIQKNELYEIKIDEMVAQNDVLNLKNNNTTDIINHNIIQINDQLIKLNTFVLTLSEKFNNLNYKKPTQRKSNNLFNSTNNSIWTTVGGKKNKKYTNN
jgi:hypothetical protein